MSRVTIVDLRAKVRRLNMVIFGKRTSMIRGGGYSKPGPGLTRKSSMTGSWLWCDSSGSYAAIPARTTERKDDDEL